MLRIVAAALFALLFSGSAYCADQAIVVTNCGSISYDSVSPHNLTMDSTGRLCDGGGAPGALTPLTPMQAGLAIVSSTALTVPSGSTYAVVCARGANVDFTTDGTTTPTASVGMQLLQNQCVGVQGGTTLSNFRAIQQSATATLDVSYYK